jgi:hypothetical protein
MPNDLRAIAEYRASRDCSPLTALTMSIEGNRISDLQLIDKRRTKGHCDINFSYRLICFYNSSYNNEHAERNSAHFRGLHPGQCRT